MLRIGDFAYNRELCDKREYLGKIEEGRREGRERRHAREEGEQKNVVSVR